MSTLDEAYVLAHTARCKLKLAADRPDRDLRFVLGHAFTFDKLVLQIAEIEREQEAKVLRPEGRRVSFQHNSNRPTGDLRREGEEEAAPSSGTGKRRGHSPPPNTSAIHDDYDDEDDEDDLDGDEEEDDGLGLCRFGSASAQPPRMLPDNDSDSDPDDDDDEPVSPPSLPSDADLADITEGDGDDSLLGFYNSIRRCPCRHSHAKAPEIASVWEVPQDQNLSDKDGKVKSKAVIQLRA